jgi:phosphate/sulfate permease
MITLTVLVLATLFLAYSNGANDNFKGVATLFGSGTLSYKAAITVPAAVQRKAVRRRGPARA